MIYYLFRFLGAICPHLPSTLGYWLFARFADLAFLFSPRDSPYFRNLSRVLGESATSDQVRAIARRGYQNLLKNYFDLFRAHGLTQEQIESQLAHVEGLEHLENAMRQGKGVIAGSGHFGAWDMVINLTAVYLKTPVVVAHEHLKPEKLSRYVLNLRRAQGMEMVPIENAPREIIKGLRAGRIVGLAYDRDITGSGQIVDFFGAPARLPDGGVQLGLKFSCPVLIGFAVREPDNRARVIIEPALYFHREGSLEEDLQAGVRKLAAIMEKYFRQYPDQWLMFQEIWDSK